MGPAEARRYLTRILAVCGLAHWMALAACATSVPTTPDKIPFVLTDGLLISLPAMVDGTAGDFLLDTGAGIHVVASSVLTRISARPAGRYTGFRHTGERVDFDMYRISSVTVGTTRLRDPLVGGWPLLDQLKIAGILSARIFEDHPATLDFRAKALIFETAETLPARVRSGRRLPLGISRDRDKSLELFADFIMTSGGRRVEAECKLDTGLDGCIVDTRLMASLGLAKESPAVTRRETRSLFGAAEIQYRTELSGLQLRDRPDVAATNVEVVFKERLTGDCLVGTRFWLDRLVTIDLENARLIVE